MDAVVLVLCLALTFLLIGILINGFYRVRTEIHALEAEVEKLESCASEIVVKQTAGDVKFSYLAEPKGLPREESVQPEMPVTMEDGVFIRPSERLSFPEKYEQLPRRIRDLLDAFTKYLTAKPDCEKVMQTNALLFRYKKGTVAKATIRRDTVILQLNVLNPNVGRLVREEKLKSVKLNPAEVRLTGETELEYAKQTADITLNYLQSEEQYRLEKRREARREAAHAKRNEEITQ